MKTLLLSTAATALLALAPAAAQETQEREETETPETAATAPQTEAERYFGEDTQTEDELTADNEDFRADRAPGQAAMDDEAYGPETEQAAVPEEEPALQTQDSMADRVAEDRQRTMPAGEGAQETAQEELTPVPAPMETAEDAETLNRLQQEELAQQRRMRQDDGATQTAGQEGQGQGMMGQGMDEGMMGEGEPMMRPQDRMAQGMDRQRMDRQAPDLDSAALIYRSTAALNPTALTAQEMLGADLVNEAGEELARVEDVIIDQQGMVQGVILAAGGLFGLGEDNYAIEFDRIEGIRTGEEIEIVSQLSERDIERLRRFDLEAFEEDMGALMMVSELRGMDLPIGESDETASVEDVVMARTGQVEALVVSYDGDRYVAPFSEIGVAEGAGGLFIDTEPRLIGAMAVYEGLTGASARGQSGDSMTRTPAAPRAMDRDAGMEPRMERDRRMQDAPVAPDDRRMKRGDTTEQGMGQGMEMETDDSMGMGEELGTEEEPGGGNQ